MGCNPESGDLREITDAFNLDKAKLQGYTSIFKVGEIIRIRDCYFSINNFVESHGFMNLKLMSNKEALEALSTIISKGEIFEKSL